MTRRIYCRSTLEMRLLAVDVSPTLVLASLCCLGAPSTAMARSYYETVLLEYRQGHRDEALRAASELNEEEVATRARDFLEGEPSLLDLETAVVLHTELAYFREPGSKASNAHAEAAARVLERVDQYPEAASFVRTSLLLRSVVHQAGSWDLDRLVGALEPLERAEKRWPADPLVQLALGAVFEKASDLTGRDVVFLETSIAHYRIALASEPGLAEGHLRLGRVLALVEDESLTEEAMRELEWVIRNTRTPDLHYLGHLFRGQLYARTGKAGDALRAYRSAVSAQPTGQTALIALSLALRLEGRRQESYAVLKDALALPVFDSSYVDDYRLYRFGLVRWLAPLVATLRSRVLEQIPE